MTKKTNLKYLKKAESASFYLSLDEKLRWIKLLDFNENEWTNIWNSFFSKRNK
jgi:Leucine-rich repeat (LRR) protein